MMQNRQPTYVRMGDLIQRLIDNQYNLGYELSQYVSELYGLQANNPDVRVAVDRLTYEDEDGNVYPSSLADEMYVNDVKGIISGYGFDLKPMTEDEVREKSEEEHLFEDKEAGDLYSYFKQSVEKNNADVSTPDKKTGLLIPNRAPVVAGVKTLVTAKAMSGVAAIYDKGDIKECDEKLDRYLVANIDQYGNELDIGASIKINENLRVIAGTKQGASKLDGGSIGKDNSEIKDEITNREDALIYKLESAMIPRSDQMEIIQDFKEQNKKLNQAYLKSINEVTENRPQSDPAVKRMLDERVALHAKNLSDLARKETESAKNVKTIKTISSQLSGYMVDEAAKQDGKIDKNVVDKASEEILKNAIGSVVNDTDALTSLIKEIPSHDTATALKSSFQLAVTASSNSYDEIYKKFEELYSKKTEDLLKESNITADPNDTQSQRQEKIDKLNELIIKGEQQRIDILSGHESIKKHAINLDSECLNAVQKMPIDKERKASFVKEAAPIVEAYSKHEETHQPNIQQINGVIDAIMAKKQNLVEISSEQNISDMGEFRAVNSNVKNKVEIALVAASIREAENAIASVEDMKARGVNAKGIIDSAIAQSNTIGLEYLSNLMIQRQKELKKISFEDVMHAHNDAYGESKDVKKDELAKIINLVEIFNEGTNQINSVNRTQSETRRDIEHNESATKYAANQIIFEAGKDGKLHDAILRYNGKVSMDQQIQEYTEKARLAAIELSNDKVDPIHTGFFGPSAKLKAKVDEAIFRYRPTGEMEDGLHNSDKLKNALRKSNNAREIANLCDETALTYLSDIGKINRVATDSGISGGTVSPEVIKKLANFKELSVALSQDLKTVDASDISSSEKRADALQRSAALRELMVRELSQIDTEVAKARGVCAQAINKQRAEEKTKTTILMLLCAVASVALTIAAIVTGIEGDIDQSKADANPNPSTPSTTNSSGSTPTAVTETTGHAKTVDPTTLVTAGNTLQSIPNPPHFTLPQPPPNPPPIFVAPDGHTFNPYTSPSQVTAGMMAEFAKNPNAACTNWQAIEANPSANTFVQWVNAEVPVATNYVSAVTSAVQSVGTSLSNNGFIGITPQAESNAVNTITNNTNTVGKNGQETLINTATYDLDKSATYIGMSGLVVPPKTFIKDAQESTQYQQFATNEAITLQPKINDFTSKYDLPSFNVNKANPFTSYFAENKNDIISTAKIYAPQAVQNAQTFAAQKAEYPGINAIPETVQKQTDLYNKGVADLGADINTAMVQNANKNGNTVTPPLVSVGVATTSDFTMAPNNYQQEATANTTASIVTGTMGAAVALGAVIGFDAYRPRAVMDQEIETGIELEDEIPDREIVIDNVQQKVAYTSKDGAPMGEKIFPQHAKPIMSAVERVSAESNKDVKKVSTQEDRRDYFAVSSKEERDEIIKRESEAAKAAADKGLISGQSTQEQGEAQPKQEPLNWTERLAQKRIKLQDMSRQY